MDLELADLRAYLVLVREGSYRRAAPAAHLTPSGLSRAVRRLETAVGERLVRRDAGGVRGFTPAGLQLAQGAERILAATQAAVEQARSAARVPPVLVGFPGVASASAAAPTAMALMRELARSDPSVNVRFVGVSFHDMWQSLRDERVDVTLNSVPCPDERIVSTPMAPMTRIAVPGPYSRVELVGAPGAWHYADHRRADRRASVRAVVQALRSALNDPAAVSMADV